MSTPPPPPGSTGTNTTGPTTGTSTTDTTTTTTGTTTTTTDTSTTSRTTKLLACSSSFLTPALSRATTNNRCIVNSKFTITYTPVTIDNQRVLIPCPLFKYLSEIKILMQTQSLKNAIIEIANKYNIPLEQPQNIKRYTYPTVNGRISTPLIQYNSTFKLVKNPDAVQSTTFNTSLGYSEVTHKSYLVGVCNDDTKTFSYTYTDMALYAGYLLSTLNIEPINNVRIYCITCRTNDRNLVKTISGYIRYFNNQLFFTPVISKLLLPRYIPYNDNTDITILYTNNNLEDTIDYNRATFHKNTIRPN